MNRDRSRRIPYHGYEHEHYQSNDTYKKGAGGVLPRSQRGDRVRRQIGDAVRKHADGDRDEFWDGKKARSLDHEGGINIEDPWKRRNHSQDTESWRPGSCNDGVEKNNFFSNDVSHNRKFLRERCGHDDSFDYRGCPAKDKSKEICHDRKNSDPRNVLKNYKTIVTESLSHSHLMRDNEGFRDSQQKLHAADQTVRTTSSPIHFDQNVFAGFRLPSITKSSNPNGQCQNPASNPEDEEQNSTNQASTIRVRSSDPFSSNLHSRISPARIGPNASINPEELTTSLKKLEPVHTTIAPSDRILNSSTHSANREAPQAAGSDFSRNFIETKNQSNSKSTIHSEPDEVLNDGMEDKGIRMFRLALAEFAKEILKPVWKEGRLSKEAHRTVVKKVVDKVVGVLGANIPRTPERIDQYLSFAKEKLHKLVQDYLEMFINT